MPHSAYGANPETANRILGVIRERVDNRGFWEERSLSQSIAYEIKVSERTVRYYLRALKSMGMIAVTKVKRQQKGGERFDLLKLLKPKHVVIKEGGLLTAVVPDSR